MARLGVPYRRTFIAKDGAELTSIDYGLPPTVGEIVVVRQMRRAIKASVTKVQSLTSNKFSYDAEIVAEA